MSILFHNYKNARISAGPGSSVGCASAWHMDGHRVRSSGPATFFRGDWSCNHFCSHSLHTADSKRKIVSYRRNDVHLILVNCLGSLPRHSVVRLADRLDMTKVVNCDVKSQIKQTKARLSR